MKKALTALIFGLLFLGIFFILIHNFPKNTYYAPFLILLLASDFYVWSYVNNRIKNLTPGLRSVIFILYWLPLASVFGMIISGFIYPFLKWNIPARAYAMGIIGIIYVIKFIPAVVLIFTDLIRTIRRILRYHRNKSENLIKNPRWQLIIMNIAWIVSGLLFFLTILGMTVWVYDFRVQKVTVTLPRLPESFNGMRIAQISDIHLGTWTQKGKLETAVDSVNALHPDVVFMTGDMFTYATSEGPEFEKILGKLKAREGIFAILGNHDYGDYIRWPDYESKQRNFDDMLQFFNRLGWKLLLNEHAVIRRGNDSIAILGTHNWGLARRFQRLGNVNKAAAGVEWMPVQLLLTHDPSYWDKVISHSHPYISITFSGHTHGFQCGIITDSYQWSPLEWMYKEWAGLYKNELLGHTQYLYVNRGLGTVTFPGRIGSLPEITLFTLVNKPQ